MVWMHWDCRLSTGLPCSSRLQYVSCEAGSVKPGQKSCVRSSEIITLSARRPSDSSGRSLPQTRPQWSITSGHQCSETMLTWESWYHLSTPLGIEPGSLMTGRKWVVHWTSETWCECSEITGSPQYKHILRFTDTKTRNSASFYFNFRTCERKNTFQIALDEQ
jgi:hypothetical protein